MCHLKEIFKKNAFSIKFIDRCVKIFLNKRLTEIPVTLIAEEKDFLIVLPFLDTLSLDLRTKLENSVNRNLPYIKIRVISKSSTRICNFFQFKDKILCCFHSNVVYKFPSGRCSHTYYGEACQHFSVSVGK